MQELHYSKQNEEQDETVETVVMAKTTIHITLEEVELEHYDFEEMVE